MSGRSRIRAAAAAAVVTLAALVVPATFPGPADGASIYCSSSQESRQIVELVHGYNSGPDTWDAESRNQISRAGSATCVDVFDYAKYSTYWVTNPGIGPALAARIDTMAAASRAGGGSGKVIIVAHSMGGLATRCAAAAACNGGRTDVAGHIAELVSFGTPNTGSWLVGPGLHDVGRTLGSLLSATCYISFNGANPICAAIRALGTSDATRAFKPDSTQLRTLPPLPATIPVYALAGHVELYSSFFGLNNTDVGDAGDLIVLEDSATVTAHKIGSLGGEQVINCGKVDITDLRRSDRSCWHSTETNDTNFLQAATRQIALVEAANTPATVTTKLTPVSATGAPLPGWSVTQAPDSVQCAPFGTAYPSTESLDDNVYSCSPVAASADACWPATDPALVYCLVNPFQHTLMAHPADGPLPPVAKEPKYVTPMGIVLSNGLVCRARNGGAWSGLDGHPGWAGWFFCGRGDPFTSGPGPGQVVWAAPGSTSGIDERSRTWSVYIGADDGHSSITKVNVTKAIFVGYP